MIPFIFVMSIIMFIFLVLSFIMKEYIIALLSCFGLMFIGVYILIHGMEQINDLLTLCYGLICLCLGLYIFLAGTIEKIQEDIE